MTDLFRDLLYSLRLIRKAPAFRSVLYEVPAADPITMGGAALVVLAIAMAATLVAVWGAMGVDPAAVLRDE